MRYTKQSFRVELIGVRHGYLWGGGKGWQDVNKHIKNGSDLRKVAKDLLRPDFEDGKLTPDSFVLVTLMKENRTSVTEVSRAFDVAMFPSLTDCVEEM